MFKWLKGSQTSTSKTIIEKPAAKEVDEVAYCEAECKSLLEFMKNELNIQKACMRFGLVHMQMINLETKLKNYDCAKVLSDLMEEISSSTETLSDAAHILKENLENLDNSNRNNLKRLHALEFLKVRFLCFLLWCKKMVNVDIPTFIDVFSLLVYRRMLYVFDFFYTYFTQATPYVLILQLCFLRPSVAFL
mgnify:CR=1 FL=1